MTSLLKMKANKISLLILVIFSFFFLYYDTRFLFYCSTFHFVDDNDDSRSIPVVYIHYNEDSLLPTYLKDAMEITLSYDNEVHLISQPLDTKVPTGCVFHNMWLYVHDPIIAKFKHAYYSLHISPIGYLESNRNWEFHNIERFFILKNFIEKEKYDNVFYVDSDSVLLTRVRFSLFQPKQSAWLSLEYEKNAFEKYYWVVWAGVSLLNLEILQDFTQFSYNLYSNRSYWNLLILKDKMAPWICDMTIWYLFSGVYDSSLRTEWKWPEKTALVLPGVNSSGFLGNIQDLGFDHRHGHKKCLPLLSYHFQGMEKSAISYLKPSLKKKSF